MNRDDSGVPETLPLSPGPFFFPRVSLSLHFEMPGSCKSKKHKVKINKNTERYNLGSIGSDIPTAPCPQRHPWQVMG